MDDKVEKIGDAVRVNEENVVLVTDSANRTLLPLCDVAGYSCFVAWAFLIGWDRGLVAKGFYPEEEWFFILRGVLFAGVALGSCLFFLVGDGLLSRFGERVGEGIVAVLCSACSATFFLSCSAPVCVVLWLVSGVAQSVFFYLWGSRFRILSRRQQICTVCGAFVVGGLSLALLPFIDSVVAWAMVLLLPLASFAFYLVANRHYGADGAPIESWRKKPSAIESLRGLRFHIPFEEDRRLVILKGLFALLYSMVLGFAACTALCFALYPTNAVLIGLGNVVPALLMAVLLHGDKRGACNLLTKLFLPVGVAILFVLGIAWPNEAVLIAAFIAFVLFGCYEVLNAYTTYAFSEYDAVRCMWELRSSKIGNATGFFLGWLISVIALTWLNVSPSHLVLLCFALAVLAVAADAAFFSEMRLEFREVVVNSGASLEMLAPKAAPIEPAGESGRWSKVCDKLAEEYKLSPRQAEIFLLLAKGRNVQFIKDKLVLSAPTVKSHVYNVYQKMGVHSHQELLNLVEERMKES